MSREIDAEVAERVMGLHDIRELQSGLCHDPGRGEWVVRGLKYHLVPEYSTDIAAAFQVVEILCARRGWEIHLSWESPVWSCYIRDDSRGTYNSEGYTGTQLAYEVADTAPMAICLAALKCVAALKALENKQ